MQLIGAHIFQPEPVGRAAEVAAELGDRVDVGLLRRRGEIADSHVLDHAPAQRADFGHRKLLSGEGGSGNPKPLRQETASSNLPANGYRAAVSFNPHSALTSPADAAAA